MACAGECAGLLWEAHLIRATGASEHEHALILWRWKRRRAEVELRPFTDPLPESPVERELRRVVAQLQTGRVAA